MSSWYAVQSKSHNETRVRPLFPGYLSARFEAADRNPMLWNAVRWAPDVEMILNTEEGGVALKV